MEDEPSPGLDRAAVQHGTIGRDAGIDVQLLENLVKAYAVAHLTDADAQRAMLVMHAHDIDRALEARVEHAGHGQKDSSGKILFGSHLSNVGVRPATARRFTGIAPPELSLMTPACFLSDPARS